MFGSAILELALGLCLIYLMFGGICSTVREYVARIFSEREKMLVTGLSRVLGAKPPAGAGADPTPSPPDGVPAPVLTLDEHNLAGLVLAHPLLRALAQASKRPSYVPARTFALALLDIITPAGGATRSVASVRAAVASIPSKNVRDALLPLIDHSAGDLAGLQANIERHFDDAMDRLSGAYKRRSQWIIVIIALVVTVSFNVDTFSAAKALWASPAVRAAVVQQGSTLVKVASPSDGSAAVSPTDLQLLPVGWYGLPKGGCAWTVKILGWLVTAFALTLGTPFWFDLLTQLVNLRSAGPKPARSSD